MIQTAVNFLLTDFFGNKIKNFQTTSCGNKNVYMLVVYIFLKCWSKLSTLHKEHNIYDLSNEKSIKLTPAVLCQPYFFDPLD